MTIFLYLMTAFQLRCQKTEPSVLSAPVIYAQHKCGANLFPDKKGFKVQSKENVLRLKKNIGNLKARESALLTLADRFPPAVVHRTNREKLSQIQRSGSIKSPAFANGLDASDVVTHSGYYSRAEEFLFNSSSCVFASLGPCDGRPQYGEVKICLRDLMDLDQNEDRFIWASHTTGYELANRQRLTGDTLVTKFKESVVVPEDFREFLGFFMINALRKLPCGEQERIMSELEKAAALPTLEEASRRWWTIIDQNRLGYLEVKFDQFIPLEDVRSIEAPQ